MKYNIESLCSLAVNWENINEVVKKVTGRSPAWASLKNATFTEVYSQHNNTWCWVLLCWLLLMLSPVHAIVSNPLREQLCLFYQVYWMILSRKIFRVLSELAQVKTEWGVRGEGEKESGRSTEWGSEHWSEMEMAWVRNVHLWNYTPEYFYQCKLIEEINCKLNQVGLKFFSFTGAATFILMMKCFTVLLCWVFCHWRSGS